MFFILLTFSLATNALLTVADYVNTKIFPNIPSTKRIFYGNGSSQFGDLFIPANGDKPYKVVVLIHGGCWYSSFGLLPLSSLAKSISTQGYAVWSLEYRRIGNGGGWPTTFQDIMEGTDYLRSFSQTYSLDLTKVVAAGHSAGGHLALWLAARKNLPSSSIFYQNNPLAIKGVISLAGIPDLEKAIKQGVCGSAAQTLVGGPPMSVPDRYRQVSVNYLLPLRIHQVFMQGREDPLVPITYTRSYLNYSRPFDHNLINFLVFNSTGHFELVYPPAEAGGHVKTQVKYLFGLIQ